MRANAAALLLALAGLAGLAYGWDPMSPHGYLAQATPAGLLLVVALSLLVEGARRSGNRPAFRRVLLTIALGVFGLVAITAANYLLGFEPLWYWPEALARSTGRQVLAPIDLAPPILLAGLCVAGALCLLLLRHARRRLALGLALVGLWASAASFIGGLAGAELVFGTGLRFGSPLTAVAMFAVCFGLALGCGLRELGVRLMLGSSSEVGLTPEERGREARALTVASVAFGTILVCAAAFVRIQVRDTEQSIGGVIAGVGALKTEEFVHWRAERLGDLKIVLRQPALRALWRGEGTQEQVRGLLVAVQQSYGYKALVAFDASFGALVSTDQDLRMDVAAGIWAELRAQPQREIAAEFVDDPASGVCLDFVGVVRDDAGRVLGGVLTRFEASRDLLPGLQRWPVQSASAEVMLVRREGEHGRVLTTPRPRRGAVFRHAIPLTADSEVVAAQGLFKPPGTVLHGVDIRGVPAIAVAHRVPESDWVLVAKMDRTEALVHARDQLIEVGLAVALVLGVAGLSVRLLWRHRQQELIERAREAESSRLELAERFGVFMRQANDAIVLFDADQRVVESNPRALELYGYTQDELLQLRAADLREPAERANAERSFAVSMRGGLLFQTVHQRKNGEQFPVEVSSRAVQLGKRPLLLSIIRDISERRRHEREIERLSRLYLLTSRVLELIFHSRTREDLFSELCTLLVQLGGLRLAWVGLHDPGTSIIRPVASYGEDNAAEYTADLRISTESSVPEGRGPTGTALRQGRTFLCNDIATDPAMRPWRDRAASSRLNAIMALPLHCEGELVGVLSLYSAEKNFFGARQVEQMERAAENISFALAVFARDERRRAAEAELKAGRDRLDFILSATTAINFTLDPSDEHRVTFISANVEDLLGYAPTEFYGAPSAWTSRVHPDDLGRVTASLMGWDRRTPMSREYRFRRADGEYRWLRDEMRLVRDGSGRPHEIVGCWIDVTSSKELAVQLERSEQLYRLIAENTNDAIWLYEMAAARFTYMNPAGARLLGYTREELLAMPLPRVLSPAAAARAQAQIEALLEEAEHAGSPTRHRVGLYEHVRQDGSIIIGEIVASLVFDENRKPVALLGVTRDVTARVAAEAELRKLSLAVEQNPASIVITDLNGAIEYVNAQFTHVTGYTFDEVRGRNPRLLKSGLTPSATYEEMWATLTQGQPWRGELINRKKDGSLHTEMIIITAVTNSEGQPTHYIALKEDISERKRAEAELRKLSRAVEQAPLSIVITDLTGAIEYVNPWFTRLTGYTPEEARGQNPRILKSGETPDAVYTDMWATLSRGETWRGELFNRKKNGEVYCESAVIAPIAGPDGGATHYVAIKEDITDRKRGEAALRESEARFRDLFDLESDTILLLEADSGRILQANRAASELYGYSVDELLLMRNIELSAEPEQTVETARAGASQPDNVVQVPTRRHRRRDGTVFPVDMNLRFFQRGGRPYYLAAIRDVTERQRAEEALHELVKQLRALHAVTIALQQPDLPREKILGIIAPHLPASMRSPRDAMASMRIDEVHVRVGEPGEPIERFSAPVRINGRAAGAVEIGYVRGLADEAGALINSRERETIESVARTLGLGLGARESFAAVQQFNAELEQRVAHRTEELAARNREMRALLQSIPDMVVRARRNGAVVYSQGAQDAAHPLPVSAPPFIPADLLGALVEAGRRALADGGIAVEEFERAAAGERAATVLELRAAPAADDEFVVFVRDITRRKHLEAQTVAMLARERQVSEMKTRFISVASHEFRTPMAAALGSAELLRNHLDRLTPTKRDELFNRMGDAMRRMTEMLDEMLMLSRVDSGRVRPQAMTMNLVRFAREVVDEVRLGDREAHRFEFRVEGAGEEFTLDASILRHILSNLLTNAARYSPAGSEVVTTVQLRESGAEIEVLDHGIGIAPEDLGRIFGAFERGSNVGNIKGTGLGLNIVKRMTELLGGSVSMQSTVQVGSRFTVFIPRQPPPAA